MSTFEGLVATALPTGAGVNKGVISACRSLALT